MKSKKPKTVMPGRLAQVRYYTEDLGRVVRQVSKLLRNPTARHVCIALNFLGHHIHEGRIVENTASNARRLERALRALRKEMS